MDALIIGAGAVGSVFAALLAEAGKRVLVLEAGAARQLQDLISSQIWARRLKWGLAPILASGEDRLNHNIMPPARNRRGPGAPALATLSAAR